MQHRIKHCMIRAEVLYRGGAFYLNGQTSLTKKTKALLEKQP